METPGMLASLADLVGGVAAEVVDAHDLEAAPYVVQALDQVLKRELEVFALGSYPLPNFWPCSSLPHIPLSGRRLACRRLTAEASRSLSREKRAEARSMVSGSTENLSGTFSQPPIRTPA